jgi:hypothetical protein
MSYYHDEILTEVRRNKAELLETYGGVDGLLRHMDEERPQLEKDGWKFVDIDKVRDRNYRRQMAESL